MNTERSRRFAEDATRFEIERRKRLPVQQGQFLGVFGGQVYGPRPKLDELLEVLKQEGLSPGDVYIGRLSSDEERRAALSALRSMVIKRK